MIQIVSTDICHVISQKRYIRRMNTVVVDKKVLRVFLSRKRKGVEAVVRMSAL